MLAEQGQHCCHVKMLDVGISIASIFLSTVCRFLKVVSTILALWTICDAGLLSGPCTDDLSAELLSPPLPMGTLHCQLWMLLAATLQEISLFKSPVITYKERGPGGNHNVAVNIHFSQCRCRTFTHVNIGI